MKQITNITLNINNDDSYILYAKQFDRNTRFLHINLYDDNVVEIDKDMHPLIIVSKSDGTQVINNCNVLENNIIEAEITYQMLSICGIAKAEIMIYNNNGDVLTSGKFYINVKKSLYDNKSVESSNEYNSLVDALSVATTFGTGLENLNKDITSVVNITNNNTSDIDNIKINIDELNHIKADKDDILKISSGTPLIADSIENMTDITRIYVNTSDGMIYANFNGEWINTNLQYQSTGIADNSITKDKLASDIIECSSLMPLKNYAKNFNSSVTVTSKIYEYNKTNSIFSKYIDTNGIPHFKIIKSETDTAYAPYFGLYNDEKYIQFKDGMRMHLNIEITGNITAKLQFYYCDSNKNRISTTQSRDFSVSGENTIAISDTYKADCAYIEITAVMINSTTDSGSIDMYGFKVYVIEDMEKGENLADKISNTEDALTQIKNVSNSLDFVSAKRQLNLNPSAYNNIGDILYLFDGTAKSISDYSVSDNCYINSKSLKTYGSYSRTYTITVPEFSVSINDYIGIYINISREDISKVKTMKISFNNSDNTEISLMNLGSWNLQNGWYLYKVKSQTAGTISNIVVTFYTDEEITVYFDSIVKNRKSKTKLLLCYDNWSATLDDTYQLLSSYGFKGTFCITNNHTHKTFETIYNTLINNGWDIAYYNGYGERPEDTATQEEWDTFICTAMNNLLYSGCIKPITYFCRWNTSTPKIINACKKAGFKMLRMSHSNPYIDDYNYNSFEIPCTQILNNNLDTVKSYIDEAIERGSSLSIFAHQILPDTESNETDTVNVNITTYTALLDYIKEKINSFKIEIVTYKDLYNELS